MMDSHCLSRSSSNTSLRTNCNYYDRASDQFVSEILIDKYPDNVRFYITSDQTLLEIEEETGASIEPHGTYIREDYEDRFQQEQPYLVIKSTRKENVRRAVTCIMNRVEEATYQPRYQERLQIGLEDADPGYNPANRVIGDGSKNLRFIYNQTGASVTVRGRGSGYIEPQTGWESSDPLHIVVEHESSYDHFKKACCLSQDLIETVREEWYRMQKQLSQHERQEEKDIISRKERDEEGARYSMGYRHDETRNSSCKEVLLDCRCDLNDMRQNVRGLYNVRRGWTNECSDRELDVWGSNEWDSCRDDGGEISSDFSRQRRRDLDAKRQCGSRSQETNFYRSYHRSRSRESRDYNNHHEDNRRDKIDERVCSSRGGSEKIVKRNWPVSSSGQYGVGSGGKSWSWGDGDTWINSNNHDPEWNTRNDKSKDGRSDGWNQLKKCRALKDRNREQLDCENNNQREQTLFNPVTEVQGNPTRSKISNSFKNIQSLSPTLFSSFHAGPNLCEVTEARETHKNNYTLNNAKKRKSPKIRRDTSDPVNMSIEDPISSKLEPWVYEQTFSGQCPSEGVKGQDSIGQNRHFTERQMQLPPCKNSLFSRLSPHRMHFPTAKHFSSFRQFPPEHQRGNDRYSLQLNDKQERYSPRLEDSIVRREEYNRNRPSNNQKKQLLRYKVAVIDKKFNKLVPQDENEIRSLINQELSCLLPKKYNIDFLGFGSHNYIYILMPHTLESMNWLLDKLYLESLHKNYIVFPYEDIYNRFKVKTKLLFDILEGYRPTPDEVILELGRINDDLCTEMWKTIKFCEEGDTFFMMISIDFLSYLQLRKINWKPNYRLSNICLLPLKNEKGVDERFNRRSNL